MAKTKIKNVEECSALFEIEVSKEDISKAFEEVYKEITKVANIPGFRAGKAPIELVKKHYTKDAREEVLKRLIPDSYRNALSEHGVHPIGMPEITDVKFEEDLRLSFRARVDTRPKFKLKNYKGMKIEKKKVKIGDEEMDKTLQNLRDINAKFTAVEDRPAQMGDYVVSDLECLVDGKPAHKKRENLWLYMDKDSIVKGLSEGMVGMNKGDEKDIDLVLPEKYPDKNLAGKNAKYHIKAKEIKKRELPNVDDELAKDLGKTSLEELKKEIVKELEARAKVNAEVDAENQLLNKLMDDNVFSVPSSFAARQLDFMVEDAKRHLEEKGFTREELNKKDGEFKAKFKDDSVRRVRLLFILDEIANAEKVEVSDADVDQAYKAIAAQTGKAEAEIRGYYEKENLVDNLKDKIREEKTIKLVMDNAQITEN